MKSLHIFALHLAYGGVEKAVSEFSNIMAEIVKAGATIVGGCCGTTPEFIKRTVDKTKDLPFTERNDYQTRPERGFCT